jgi:tyrosine-specific transport protein
MLGGIFLICGTSIGTGILGVPSVTATSGLMNSLILFFICWLFSTLAALYYMEAHLWQASPSSNLLSMTEYFFGSIAKSIVWIIYLGLLYSLMCTYLLAGSSWIIEALSMATQIKLGQIMGMTLFILFIGLFIFFGIRAVDRANRFMSFGLAVSFLAILAYILPTVTLPVLVDKGSHWTAMPSALPLLITAFGYSIIVPSLDAYFNKQAHLLQQAIIIGSLLTLVIYILWQVGTYGNIPLLGAHGLSDIAKNQDNGTEVANSLIYFAHNPYLSVWLTLFAIFAVITSFLGVSMALYHALSDGLKMNARGVSGVFVLLLTYIPPMIFLLVFPTGFSQILSCAGALVALLMGLIPVAMVWKGRYVKQLSGYRVSGGKGLLLIVGIFFLGVLVAEILR